MGDKCTFADLAFMPWNYFAEHPLGTPPGEDKFEGFPDVKAWHERMIARPSWKKAMETRARLMDEQGLDWNGLPKGIKNVVEFEEKLKRDQEAKGR